MSITHVGDFKKGLSILFSVFTSLLAFSCFSGFQLSPKPLVPLKGTQPF